MGAEQMAPETFAMQQAEQDTAIARSVKQAIQPKGACPECGGLVRLRTAGQFKGSLYKHRRFRAGWCEGGGMQPEPSDLVNTVVYASGGYLRIGPSEASPRDILADWWRQAAESEIGMVVDKAIEYGATDLYDLGRDLYEMAGREVPDDHGMVVEAGIAFYVAGKLSRVKAAIKEGRQVSADTWLDIGVYARMAQRVHQMGAWPGV